MKLKNKHNTTFLLLFGCIVFSLIGITVLFLGALSHINPSIHFTALFAKEPLMNLAASILPSFFNL